MVGVGAFDASDNRFMAPTAGTSLRVASLRGEFEHLPVVSAAAGVSIPRSPWEHLLGFAGLWLAIYGGGHTIKSVVGWKARSGPMDRLGSFSMR
jgi:hypothetical protein